MMRPIFILLFIAQFISSSLFAYDLAGETTRHAKPMRMQTLLRWIDSLNHLRPPYVSIGRHDPGPAGEYYSVKSDSSQLTGDYWETTMYLYAGGYCVRVRMVEATFVSIGDTIIYAHVADDRINDTVHVYLDSLLEKSWNRLQREWKTTFGGTGFSPDTLLAKEDKDDPYGPCSYTPEPSSSKLQMEKWIAAKDTAALSSWLHSPLPGKQAYAVEGFYRLKEKGMKLSPKQLAMIRAVQQRKATVAICEPGKFGWKKLPEVTSQFSFD